jgi:hypothetical protein
MPQFESWTHENLVKFAYDAYRMLQTQDDQLQQLRNDLKDAIKAYREVHADNNNRL